MRLRLEGIGALLREENGNTIVVQVVPGGAAAKDGRLKANDKIVAVAPGDDKFVDVVDMKLRDAVKLIRGPKGTQVELKVVPAGKLEPVVRAHAPADRDQSPGGPLRDRRGWPARERTALSHRRYRLAVVLRGAAESTIRRGQKCRQ